MPRSFATRSTISAASSATPSNVNDVGSSTSKPRKGHEKPKHLPKVGSPANQQWEHETHKAELFGSTARTAAIAIIGIFVVFGLLILTL
jgi:hypothetical protein